MSQICCKFEVNFFHSVEKIDLLIWNFLPNNLLRFVILQKNWHTAKKVEKPDKLRERWPCALLSSARLFCSCSHVTPKQFPCRLNDSPHVRRCQTSRMIDRPVIGGSVQNNFRLFIPYFQGNETGSHPHSALEKHLFFSEKVLILDGV